MIHLGYEIGSGKSVSIPLQHMAVTGQTQLAGKTTTLEALISRSKLRALTFITKRGESSFQSAPHIQPYFRDRADWQYVSAILEATLREKLKFERSWIMDMCKGAGTLKEVANNVEEALGEARGLNKSVLTTLHAYLDLVLPQIQSTKFAGSIKLAPGINVMDLSSFRLELQSLIIRSAIEWVYEKEDHTVVIIPEARDFIPQHRGSPVKIACEELIRKGAVLKNFVWIDSQDLAVLHKDILRSVSVWLMGVQRERNEVVRTLRHITGISKPDPGGIMQLGLGEFWACFGNEAKHVYVQPAWMDNHTAQAHAVGAPLPLVLKSRKSKDEDEEMWKEKYDALKREFDELKSKHEELMAVTGGRRENIPDRNILEMYGTPMFERKSGSDEGEKPSGVAPSSSANGSHSLDEIYELFKTRLLTDPNPPILNLLAIRPELQVTVKRPVIGLNDSTLRGKLVWLIADGFFDQQKTASAAWTELKRLGSSTAKPNVYREMDELAKLRIVTREKDGYQKAPDAVIRKVEA